VIGLETDMRASFFGAEASTRETSELLVKELDGFRWEQLDIRDAAGVNALFARHARHLELVVHAAAQPPTTGPRATPRPTSRRTRTDAEPARSNACARARRDLRLHLDEQGLRRPPEPPPARGAGDAARAAADHHWHRGSEPTCRSTRRRTRCRRLEDCSGLTRAGVRALFQMPTVCLRAGCVTVPSTPARRCTDSSPTDEVHRHRDALHRVRLRRQAGPRQHPRARLVSAIAAFHERPRPAAVYNIGGGRESNVSILEAIELCQAIAGRELTTPCQKKRGSAITAGGSARWRNSSPTTRLAPDERDRGHVARDLRAQRRALGPRRTR